MNKIPVSTITAGIGALELKHVYQKNMFLATMLSSGMALAIIGGIALWSIIQPRPLEPEHRSFRFPVIQELEPPPSMFSTSKINIGRAKTKLPAIGIPTPLPDDQVVNDVRFVTRDQMKEYNRPIAGGFDEGGENIEYVIKDPVEEIFPQPGEFRPVHELPVLVHEEKPVYPEMAERAGIEGAVWISALIDREGRVHDALITKASGTKTGFEEAALAAAKKNRYKPAIQNGRPVAVWISYRVVFQLR